MATEGDGIWALAGGGPPPAELNMQAGSGCLESSRWTLRTAAAAVPLPDTRTRRSTVDEWHNGTRQRQTEAVYDTEQLEDVDCSPDRHHLAVSRVVDSRQVKTEKRRRWEIKKSGNGKHQ